MARVEKKYEFAGVGALIQAIGVVLLFIVPIGTVVGIALLIIGSVQSRRFVCSACKNRVPSKDVKVCPACRVDMI